MIFGPIVPDSRTKVHNGCTVAALDAGKDYPLPKASNSLNELSLIIYLVPSGEVTLSRSDIFSGGTRRRCHC